MKISNFTKPELDHFRKNCNFVNYEITMFEMRSRGHTIEEVAEELNISMEHAYRISRQVNDKIIRVL
jgi:hypothetical protein